MDVYDQVKHKLQTPTLAWKFDISHWLLCGADGRTDRLVITKNLADGWISKFSKVWGYARPRFAHAWSFAKLAIGNCFLFCSSKGGCRFTNSSLGLAPCETFSSGHHHWLVKDPKTFFPFGSYYCYLNWDLARKSTWLGLLDNYVKV